MNSRRVRPSWSWKRLLTFQNSISRSLNSVCKRWLHLFEQVVADQECSESDREAQHHLLEAWIFAVQQHAAVRIDEDRVWIQVIEEAVSFGYQVHGVNNGR